MGIVVFHMFVPVVLYESGVLVGWFVPHSLLFLLPIIGFGELYSFWLFTVTSVFSVVCCLVLSFCVSVFLVIGRSIILIYVAGESGGDEDVFQVSDCSCWSGLSGHITFGGILGIMGLGISCRLGNSGRLGILCGLGKLGRLGNLG